jgi:hypothetical protein
MLVVLQGLAGPENGYLVPAHFTSFGRVFAERCCEIVVDAI